MKVNVSQIRQAYQNAKKEFSIIWLKSNPNYLRGDKYNFWKDFGEANNMKIVVDRYEAGFPKITTLEFNSEQDYVWFLLRWA